MKRDLRMLAAAGALSLALSGADAAFAQKSGGILRLYHWDSPASMSIHEENTYSTVVPMMGVFNNLVASSTLHSRSQPCECFFLHRAQDPSS